MEVKLFEVRDDMTFMPAMAIRLEGRSGKESYLLARSGFGVFPYDHRKYVLLHFLEGKKEIHYDTFGWGSPTNDRTRFNAHTYIKEHWDELKSGDVIDVEFILGEVDKPKQSEMVEV